MRILDLPADDDLASALSLLIDDAAVVTHRSPSAYRSTAMIEVVECDLGSGERVALMCKWGVRSRGGRCDHRGGVAYEAAAYDRWVDRLPGIRHIHLGNLTFDDETTCIVLEHLADAARLHSSTRSDALALAARWAGRVHAEGRGLLDHVGGFVAYDDAFFESLIERAGTLVEHDAEGWFGEALDSASGVLVEALGRDHTIIHGEFYPANVLIDGDEVVPVDFESAAIGAGEIDLAALITGWTEGQRTRAVDEYCTSRWPGGAPASFHRTMAAAELYLALRHMVDHAEPDIFSTWWPSSVRAALADLDC